MSDKKLQDLSDEDLILEFQKNGTEEAFEILVHRYKNPLTNFVFRFLGDYEACTDIVQETFLKAWRALDRSKGLCRVSMAHRASARPSRITGVERHK